MSFLFVLCYYSKLPDRAIICDESERSTGAAVRDILALNEDYAIKFIVLHLVIFGKSMEASSPRSPGRESKDSLRRAREPSSPAKSPSRASQRSALGPVKVAGTEPAKELSKEERVRADLNDHMFQVHDALSRAKTAVAAADPHNIIKILFREVQELDFVPKRLRPRMCTMLGLRTVAKGKRLILRETQRPPCFVILTGKLEVWTQKRGTEDEQPAQTLLPGSVCGNFEAFNDRRWKAADVVAVEDSSAAEFSPDALAKLILEENSNSQFKALLDFLQNAIPRFEQLSRHTQERLGRFFKERSLMPGQEVLHEGAAAVSAFLIREGICNILSHKSPLIPDQLRDVGRVALKVDRRTVMSRAKQMPGYMSSSTTGYQFQTAGAKEWVGDMAILEGVKEYVYSVVARTKTTVLEISKESMKKFPQGIVGMFVDNAKKKVVWHNMRKSQLEASITKIYNMNPRFQSRPKAPERARLDPVSPPFPVPRLHLNKSTATGIDRYNGGDKEPRSVSTIANQRRSTANISASPSRLSAAGESSPAIRKYKSVQRMRAGLDLEAAFRPQRVLMGAASLLGVGGNGGKSCLPALYRRPLMMMLSQGRLTPAKRIMNVTELGESPEPPFPVNGHQMSSFSIGYKSIQAINKSADKRPETPNPSSVWLRRTGRGTMFSIRKLTQQA